jgi:hypothetical protein
MGTARIGTCAEYVDYLPDIPDGCFPEDLLQRMFTLLIERGVLSEDALHRLLSSSMTGLNLRGWKQLSPASCSVIAQRCTLLRRLDLAGTSSPVFLFHGLVAAGGCSRGSPATAPHPVNAPSPPLFRFPLVVALLQAALACSTRDLRQS